MGFGMRSREQRRIVCVLHSPANQKCVSQTLKAARYEVVSALTAAEAIAFCVNHSLAALVLDSEFFTEEGWSVVRTLKSLCPQVPIILFVEDHSGRTISSDVDGIANTADIVLSELNRLFDRSAGPL